MARFVLGGPHERVGPDGPKSGFRPNRPVQPEVVAESLVATLGLQKGHCRCEFTKIPLVGKITIIPLKVD